MFSNRFIIFLILFLTTCSLKFKVQVDRNKGPVCFYQNLKEHQKYLFQVQADAPNYRMDVMTSKTRTGGGWKTVVSKVAKKISQTINKLAEQGGVYTFCVSSTQAKPFIAKVVIQNGLQMANFDYLPSLNDHQVLDRQIQWMSKQKELIIQQLNQQTGLRAQQEKVKSMLGITMIMLVIIGLIVIMTVNLVFYMLTKKTFKDRKLI